MNGLRKGGEREFCAGVGRPEAPTGSRTTDSTDDDDYQKRTLGCLADSLLDQILADALSAHLVAEHLPTQPPGAPFPGSGNRVAGEL